MTSYKEFVGGDLYNAGAFGTPKTATITSAAPEEVGQEKRKKIVLRFEELDKGVVCNEARCEAMAQITKSDNYEDWVGHSIRLSKGRTKFGGKSVDCIEIQPAQTADAIGDEVPF